MDRHLIAVKRRIGSMVTNVTDRDDVVQEVVLKVWLHLSTFRSESSFRTWIMRVAINEALQIFRRERQRAHASRSAISIYWRRPTNRRISPLREWKRLRWFAEPWWDFQQYTGKS